MPLSPEDLFAYLEGLDIPVTTVTHPPLRTVEESQALRGTIAGGHTKNLFLRDRKDSFFLLTVGEEATIDLKRIHEVIGAAGRVSFGRPDQLMDLLGVEPGAVTAFGIVNDTGHRVSIFFDETLMRNDVINAHPLVNTATTSIARADLRRFVESTGHRPNVLKLST
jgi:Ala-tRNA(Pro) deacylase